MFYSVCLCDSILDSAILSTESVFSFFVFILPSKTATVKREKKSEKWRWELTSLRKKNENKNAQNTQNTQKRTKKALIQQTPWPQTD